MPYHARFLTTLFCCVILAFTGFQKRPHNALAAPGKTTQKTTAPNAEKVAANTKTKAAVITAEMLREISQIRGLPIKRQVESGVQSSAEVGDMIDKTLREATLGPRIHAAEVSLKKLGLVPSDFQLRPFYVKLMSEQVAGYYNPKTKVFYLSSKIPLNQQQFVMAHELTHALQDQHFNLAGLMKRRPGNSDAELAVQSLVEGDAMFTESRYTMRHRPGFFTILQMLWSGLANSKQIASAPRSLRDTLIFPYRQGMNWVSQVHQRGGWALVSKAYTTPPQSTEQILHMEKYLKHEAPVKVDMPDASAKLGKGWKRIDYDVNGEWGFYAILNEYLEDAGEAKQAAAGWGGDRFVVYEERSSGAVIVVQLTQWDSQHDATEFYNAYAKRTELRYKNKRIITFNTPSNAHTPRSIWRTTEGAVIMERRRNQVLIAEGVPDKIDVIKLIKNLMP